MRIITGLKTIQILTHFGQDSPNVVENNEKDSTWWLRDGDFLRLKSVELGYTIPEKFGTVFSDITARVYFTGLNLLYFSKFDLWDPEMAENGLGYPPQRVFNIGLQVKL